MKTNTNNLALSAAATMMMMTSSSSHYSQAFVPPQSCYTKSRGTKRTLEYPNINNDKETPTPIYQTADSSNPTAASTTQATNEGMDTISPIDMDFSADDSTGRAIETSLLVDTTTSNTAMADFTNPLEADDPSKEILLESISLTTPKDVLGEVIESAPSNEINLNGNDENNGSHTNTIPGETASFLDSIGLENTVVTGVSSSSPGMQNDVQAILAASEEAVAAAEASMSPELVKQLEFTTTTNATTLDVAPTFVTSVETIADSTDIKTPASTTVADSVPDLVSTSPVVDEPLTKTKIDAPGVRKILKFAIPAIGVWLCGPLLSLIDTSAVGIFSGTIQQAALNPAVAVTDYAALLIAFMYTGTTNVVAAAQESDRGTVDKPRTAKTMIGAMQMSTYVGAGLGAILFVFARPLLKAIIGNDAISPAVFAAAMKYVRIRALGMPAAAIIGSTQAACLGMQDIRSPLYVLAAAAVVNFFGDVFFVGNSHPLIGGAAGAAWATVISQYVAVAFFIRWLCTKPKKSNAQPQAINVSNAILELIGTKGGGDSRRQSLQNAIDKLKMTKQRRKFQETLDRLSVKRSGTKVGNVVSKLFRSNSSTSSSAANSDVVSVRGFLNNRFSARDLTKLPDKDTRKEFAPYVVPVTTTQVGRVSGYVAMSHVVASSLGTVSMAAQQVIVSLFYCLCPIADSLSLTAQSFVPGISQRKPSMEKAAALRKVFMSLLKGGAVFGAAMVAAVAAIPLLTGFFTSDPAVIGLVNSVVPLLLVFFGTHGFVCATEGLLLGQKDLGFIGKMYALFFAAVPYLMLKVKRAALTGSRTVGLTSVWSVFVGYQVSRCAIWLVRSAMLQRRTNSEARLADDLPSP